MCQFTLQECENEKIKEKLKFLFNLQEEAYVVNELCLSSYLLVQPDVLSKTERIF